MITPAYSPTATERVLPRLALDFTTALLDSRVTVTRALNTATRINSSGYIENVNADLPRFDYDPATLACKGLLIEETRANLLTYSQQANNGIWTKVNASVTPDTVNGPDGLLSADTITAAAGTSAKAITQAGGSSGVQQTYTAYIKAGTHNFIQLWHGAAASIYANFNVATGAIGTVGANATAAVSGPVNGFYRIAITCTPGSANQFRIAFITSLTSAYAESWNALGTETVYFGGAQLEAGAFATSYIPTTTTSLTRNADVVSMTGTNLTSWLDATQGTLLSEHMVPQFNPANTILAYSLGSSAGVEVYAGIQTTGVNQFTVQNTTNQANFAGFAAGVVNVPQKVCGYFKENNFAASANGSPASTDTLGTVPSINKLIFGARNDGARVLNGWARKFAYWPFTLTTAEVTAFSKQ